eukprot:scaffold326773_cov52-Tisochrysis_lutea.AAC.3
MSRQPILPCVSFRSSPTIPPAFASAQEIVEGGVNLQLNADGVPSGECFVEFESLQVQLGHLSSPLFAAVGE